MNADHHCAYLAVLTSWATVHGIASADADDYIHGLFQGVGSALSLQQLAADHETPNGSNERIRSTWFTPASTLQGHRINDPQ